MRYLIYSLIDKISIIFRNHKKDSLRVLAYHTVPNPKKFEQQLIFLRENYNIIGLNVLLGFLKGERRTLPKRPVLITFDDGDYSVFEKGLPILQKYKIPAVVFVITELIDSNKTFWCRQIERVYKEKGLSYSDSRRKINQLKQKPERERRLFLQNLAPLSDRQMTHLQLKQLQKNQIYIGNHTHSHPMLNNCTNIEITNELKQAKKKFLEWELPGYSVFAYPNGNWDSRTESIIKKEGIEIAFLFDHQINTRRINPLRISRIRVDSNLDLPEFRVKISGLHSKIMYWQRKFFQSR